MKKWAAWLLAFWLMPVYALADIELHLASDTVAVESILDFALEGSEASEYRYTLYRGGKELFKTQGSSYAFGSYLPRETGEYILRAEAHLSNGWETVEESFTVTPALAFELAPLSPSIREGDGVHLQVVPQGGSGKYRYLYTVECDGERILQQEAENDFLWVPEQAGEYTLSVLVTDSMGAFAEKELDVQVSPGPGLSWQAAGGELWKNGGQKSWYIYAPGPWTALSASDFIHILKGEGEAGDLLILEIEEETKAFRQGAVTLQSGDLKVMLPVSQSGGFGVEEDISLSSRGAAILVEGESHLSWHNAGGERAFSIESDAPWEANADDDFIHIETEGDSLFLTVDSWEGEGVRAGLVTLENPKGAAYIHLYQVAEGEKKAPFLGEGPFPLPPEQDTSFKIYSQSSGYWRDKAYRHSNLEISGCAIFSLSHALQQLGYTGEEIKPEKLAQTYAFALMQDGSGTMNSTLVGHAGDDFGFKTRYELYEDLPTIRSKMDQGAVYSFSVVSGHIAMIIEKSEDGKMFRVVDSAPSATWERIKDASLYIQDEAGNFIPISDLSQIPGIRYYIETESFGGATYWLEGSYIAKRGVRLIQPN